MKGSHAFGFVLMCMFFAILGCTTTPQRGDPLGDVLRGGINATIDDQYRKATALNDAEAAIRRAEADAERQTKEADAMITKNGREIASLRNAIEKEDNIRSAHQEERDRLGEIRSARARWLDGKIRESERSIDRFNDSIDRLEKNNRDLVAKKDNIAINLDLTKQRILSDAERRVGNSEADRDKRIQQKGVDLLRRR